MRLPLQRSAVREVPAAATGNSGAGGGSARGGGRARGTVWNISIATISQTLLDGLRRLMNKTPLSGWENPWVDVALSSMGRT